MIRDVDSGSRVPDLDFFLPGSATLVLSLSRKLQIDREVIKLSRNIWTVYIRYRLFKGLYGCLNGKFVNFKAKWTIPLY